jgi:hypothetical protein
LATPSLASPHASIRDAGEIVSRGAPCAWPIAARYTGCFP